MKYAILIDAGFLKRKLGSQSSPTTAAQVNDFTQKLQLRDELKGHHLHRIYYYDAEPLKASKPKPLTGGKLSWDMHNFETTDMFRHNMSMLAELKKSPKVAVRLGDLSFRGWSLKPSMLDPRNSRTQLTVSSSDLVPNITQKGVDMRIGLDIAALTLKNHVDMIALVTGDSDFVPALKFTRREGKQAFVYCLGNAITDEMREHCDLCVSEDVQEILDLPSESVLAIEDSA